jgi:hypothetical protein
MHSSAEIARKRICQACTFYESKLKELGSTDFHEYFICLTNRAGNAITNLDFRDAIRSGCEALALCRNYPMIQFPAQWAAANNVVVGAVLEDRMSAPEAVEVLGELLKRFPDLDDDILINSNVGGLAVLFGKLEMALHAFALNAKRFEDSPEIDPYYFYLSESNRAIALQLLGNTAAQDVWGSCGALIGRLPPAVRADLKVRHDTLAGVFTSGTLRNARAWNSRSSEVAAANPRYRAKRFPNGIFLSDIQIWSSF